MVRHGARAPLFPQPPNVFKVAGGCLTSQGMRQRFLLGTHNRERYINEYSLLDEIYNPNQIYAQSTDVHRVIQSTYSEFMGLYPPSQDSSKLSEGEIKSLRSLRGIPPMKIRNIAKRVEEATSSEASSTLKAVIDGMTLVPVFSYIPNSPHDDVNQKGCYYVD